MSMAPNDEFIREVDEEYRRDQVAQIWKRYNGVIIGAAILLVAAVGGWRYWEHCQETRSQAAAVRYEDALQLSREDKSKDAEAALESLAKDDRGRLRPPRRGSASPPSSARRTPRTARRPMTPCRATATCAPLWQDLARLRAAWLRLDTADPATAASGARAPRRPDQCLAPLGAGASRSLRPEGGRHGFRRPLVRPDRRRPRDAARPAAAARRSTPRSWPAAPFRSPSKERPRT